MAEEIPSSVEPVTLEASQPSPEVSSAPPLPAAQPRTRISTGETFAALNYPNYRLWFYGQLASLVGTWMQSTAQGYLVFQLTHSPAYLGYVAFASGVPIWLFTLFGGVVSDRMSRRKLMIITQSSMLVLAFILAALTFSGAVQPWHIIILAFLLGIANAFDTPSRQAIVFDLVPRERLANAIALNAAMFNLATAAGPAIAGLAYAALGPGWCFTINGISFIAVIIALILMKLAPFTPAPRKGSTISELGQGIKYVIAHPSIRALILGVGSASLFGLSFVTLIPAWAVDILHGDATTNGLLQSARGVGSLVAALTIASLATYRHKGRLLTAGMLLYPVGVLIFAVLRIVPLSLLVMMVVGLGFMTLTNLSNSLVQHLVRDDLRGRVMGVYSLVFFGLMPIGSLGAGLLAAQLGAPATVEIAASLALLYALATLVFFPHLRKL